MADNPQDKASFEDTPEGWARRWHVEVTAARKALEAYYKEADEAVARYRDERGPGEESERRLPLFSSAIQLQRAMLYGKTPKADVSRAFGDAQDDLARVAAEQEERLLNADVDRKGESYAATVGYSLDERLVAGLGVARVRYEARTEKVAEVPAIQAPMGGMGEGGMVMGMQAASPQVLAPAVPAHEKKVSEVVEVDYYHHRCFLWSAGAPVWGDARWVGFCAPMTREGLVDRFGEVGRLVPLNSKLHGKGSEETGKESPWGRADVWEIWDKDTKRVFWWVEGYHQTLDSREDSYGLEGFFPCPRPLMANVLPGTLVPRPDYRLHRDAYEEIDALTTRIFQLQRAVRVAGVYDGANKGIDALLDQTTDNKLVPIAGWTSFAERGGISGAISWLPLGDIVQALLALRDYRKECIENLHLVTGMADIMRGQAAAPGATATEQRVKAGYGSVRMRALQEDFARFCTELQSLRAELVASKFAPESIVAMANTAFTADASMAMAAAEFLKSDGKRFRVTVRPEAVAMEDFAAMRQEGTEAVQAISSFLQAAAPIGQQMPGSAPFLLEILKWVLAKYKGASTLEAILDQAIAQAQKAAQAPQQAAPPDPKLQAAQMKAQADGMRAQADMQKEQFKLQADLARMQAETQAKAEQEQNQAQWNDWERQRQSSRAASARMQADVLKGGGLP